MIIHAIDLIRIHEPLEQLLRFLLLLLVVFASSLCLTVVVLVGSSCLQQLSDGEHSLSRCLGRLDNLLGTRADKEANDEGKDSYYRNDSEVESSCAFLRRLQRL